MVVGEGVMGVGREAGWGAALVRARGVGREGAEMVEGKEGVGEAGKGVDWEGGTEALGMEAGKEEAGWGLETVGGCGYNTATGGLVRGR